MLEKILNSTTILTLLTSLFRSRTAIRAFTRLESLFLTVSGITRGYDLIYHTYIACTQ